MKQNVSKKMRTCLLFLSIFLTACSNKKTNTKELENTYLESSQTDSEKSISKESETSTKLENSDDVYVKRIEDFSSELAWIEYYIENQKYLGCIDKKGNLVFSFSGAMYHTDFKNGFAHIYTNKKLYTIDLKGNIIAEYNRSDVECYDGGYVVTMTDESGFDNVGYSYKIYDPNGELQKEIKSDEQLDQGRIQYCGQGVIWFKNQGFYISKNKAFVENKDANFCTFYGDDNIAVISSLDPYFNDGKGGLLLLSVDGEITKYSSESLSDNICPSPIIDNICVVYDKEKKTIFSIDFATENLHKLSEDYAEKLSLGMLSTSSIACYDGRINLNMKGADGKNYSCVFDKELNLVFGPIEDYQHEHYADNLVLIGNERVVYDLNGNPVYSVKDLPYHPVIGAEHNYYSNGALRLEDNNHKDVFLDTEGHVLFEKINFKDALIKDLN